MKLLLCADMHIRFDISICRNSNFIDIQEQVLKQIVKIYKQNKCENLIIAGDLLNKWNPNKSQEIENLIFNIFKDVNVLIIAGNHCLPMHNLENLNKSSLGVICNFPNFHLLDNNPIEKDNYIIHGFSYNQEIKNIKSDKFNIAVIHKYCEPETLSEYINDGITASYLLEKYNFDLIITGDNHTGFIYDKDNRFVINPGCITRQVSDKKFYKPFIVLLDTENKKHEQIYLCDNNPEDVSDEHIEEIKIKEDRINSFIEKLKSQSKFDLDFINNMKLYILENKIEKEIEEMIFKIIEGGLK